MEKPGLDYLKKNSIIISIGFVCLLILINFSVSFLEKQSAKKYEATTKSVARTKEFLSHVGMHVNVADMAFRGFFIVEDKQLLHPFTDEVLVRYAANYDSLYYSLGKFGYTVSKIPPIKEKVKAYMGLISQMVELRKQQRLDEIVDILKKDPGYEVWKEYSSFVNDATAFIEHVEEKSYDNYETVSGIAFWVQVLLCLMGMPILFFAIHKLIVANKNKARLFNSIDENNKKLIFDDKANVKATEQEEIIQRLISNLKKISFFIKGITNGDYSVDWDGLNDGNKDVNRENIVGDLINMREQMKLVKANDEKRLWVTEGVSKFSEIVRLSQNDLYVLSDELISNLVKYVKANQGGIFILNDADSEDQYLELTACYAYQRKKYLQKRIDIGQGLVGQAYLEQDYVYLTEIPQNYVAITSGLGDANPESLLIVPLMYNERIEAVIELASFSKFKDYEIEFVQKIGEYVASAIASVKINERTRKLLEQSQTQAEEMKSQEEEMRQNLEELQATQEEIQRRTFEYQDIINSNELELNHLRQRVKELESSNK